MTSAAESGHDTDAPPAPFGNDQLDALLHSFNPYPHIALAVSGGADSTAFMLLCRAWLGVQRSAPPKITILTVDHGLRAGSAAEVDWVKAEAAKLDFDHHTLIWQGPKPKAGLQSAARAARYGLMTQFCQDRAIPALATAHTSDDQAETLIMRLARGSGLDGLAGMAAVSSREGVDLLRPLLGVARAQLEGFLKERGQDWLEDPSNTDERYERVRIRRLLKAADMLGLSPGKLTLAARRLNRAREALERMTADFLSANLKLHDAGFGEIALPALFDAPEEVALRSLARMTLAFGGRTTTTTQLSKIEACYRQLRSGAPSAATLGGCHLRAQGETLLLAREYGRMDSAEMPLAPAQTVLWDRRFTVSLPAGEAPVILRALGSIGISAVKAADGNFGAIPCIAAQTLPSLWTDGRLRFTPFARFNGQTPDGWSPGASVSFTNAPMIFGGPMAGGGC